MKDQSQSSNQQDKLTPQQKRQLQKLQQIRRKALESRQRCMPLVKFIKKHKLKFKSATCKKRKIDYFRVDQMQKILQDNKQTIQKDQKLRHAAQNWRKQVIYFNRPQHLPTLKYPKQLEFQEKQGKFAAFKFQTAQSKKWLAPLILFGILAVVLFPLWPYMLKYSIFIICLYLVIAIVSIIILRIVVYLFFGIFGISLWILPNFFADCTIVQSFIPFISYSKWQKGMFSIVAQIISLLIFSYYGYHLYVDPSWVYENIEITKTSYADLHDWGVGKIKGEKNFSQSALTNINDILNETNVVGEDENEQVQGLNQQQINANQNTGSETQKRQQQAYSQEQQINWIEPEIIQPVRRQQIKLDIQTEGRHKSAQNQL